MKKEDIKVLLFALLLVIFESATYLLAKLTPFKAVVLTSSFDERLPLIPFFVLLYFLWYIYLFLIPFIIAKCDKKLLFKYASITIITILLGAAIFVFFPTTIERNVDLSNTNLFFKLLLKIVYFMDTPNLCCLPSMHCALSYIFIYMILKTPNLKWYYKLLIVLSSIGIAFSTLFVKQHVIWDLLSSIPLVIIAIIIDRFTNIDRILEEKYNKINFK